jgi:hypothetical protein
LNRDAWDEQQLESLRKTLALSLETVDVPKRPSELMHDYPGSIPWWAAHLATATSLAILTLATAVFALQRLAS